MTAKLFVNTWGWLTLHDKEELQHREVVDFYASFRSGKSAVCTTDYVLDETFTLLFKRLPPFRAKQSMEVLIRAFLEDGFNLVQITTERFALVQALRSNF